MLGIAFGWVLLVLHQVLAWGACAPDFSDVKAAHPQAKQLRSDPVIISIDHFLGPEQVEHLVGLAEGRLYRPVNGSQGLAIAEIHRDHHAATNGTVRGNFDDHVLNTIEQQTAALSGVAVENLEPFQITRREAGHREEAHLDLVDYHTVPGPRVGTIHIFLHEVADGALQFPALDLEVEPQLGRAVLWWNVKTTKLADACSAEDLREDPRLRHLEKPSASREMWTADKWIHPGDFQKAWQEGQVVNPAGPLIASITFTGNAASTIADCFESATSLVDLFLLIDTGITDDTISIARSIVGDRLVVRKFPWINSFAAARTASLRFAEEVGATWAMLLDDDERLQLKDNTTTSLAVRHELQNLPHSVKRVENTMIGDRLDQNRFFRLPFGAHKWVGAVHEYFSDTRGGRLVTKLFKVFELPKGPERILNKRKRDMAYLSEEVKRNPRDTRAWYYLGDAQKGLGLKEEALLSFKSVLDLNGWDEEVAWAAYQSAQIYYEQEKIRDGIQVAARGLAAHAGFVELYWYAGWLAFKQGEHRQAVRWSLAAIQFGCFKGFCEKLGRINFRYPPAWWEAPYDVLRYALKALGDHEWAAGAEKDFDAAYAKRLGDSTA